MYVEKNKPTSKGNFEIVKRALHNFRGGTHPLIPLDPPLSCMGFLEIEDSVES